MAIEVREQVSSESIMVDGIASNITRKYWIDGAETHNDAIDALIENTPVSEKVSILLLYKKRITSLTPRGVTADGKWEGVVNWSHMDGGGMTTGRENNLQEPYDTIESFAVESQEIERYQANDFVYKPAGEEFWSEVGNLVNVDADGTQSSGGLMGREPTAILRKSILMPGSVVNPAWIQSQWDVAGKVNLYDWNGYYKSSLLFEGLNGNIRDDGNWEVEYTFLYRPPTPLSVLNSRKWHPNQVVTFMDSGQGADGYGSRFQTINGVLSLGGWQEIWLTTRDDLGKTGEVLVPIMTSIHVADMYDYINFSTVFPF